MLTRKMIAVGMFAALLWGCGGTSTFVAKTENAAREPKLNPPVENEQAAFAQIRVLAEGAHSNIHDSFVAVIRDGATYTELRKLDPALPDLDDNFFRTNAVVAAFLGERRTGGYRVEITGAAGAIHVSEKQPAKGMMVTQMITSPFKIVEVAAAANSPLMLTVDSAWQQRLFPFKVTSGQFKMTGGFAGITKEFKLEGELKIVVEGSSLATFVFAVRGLDPAKKRTLIDASTAVLTADGHITINKLTAGSLVDAPNSGLKVTGVFSESDSKVELNFVSLPSMVSDGYSGVGTLNAKMATERPGPR